MLDERESGESGEFEDRNYTVQTVHQHCTPVRAAQPTDGGVMHEGGGCMNNDYEISEAEESELDKNITVVSGLSSKLDNILERKTEEKISEDIHNHYLPEHYLLSDSNRKEGTVGREVQRLEEEGMKKEIVGGKGGGGCNKSLKKDVKEGSGSDRKEGAW